MNEKTREGMSSSKSVEWVTPKWLFDRYDQIYHFTTDVCTISNNPMGCEIFFTKETDGLKNFDKWQGNVWCNPPYGKKKADKPDPWVAKCAEYAKSGKGFAVLLIAARTDTDRFHKHIWNKETRMWRDNVLGDFIERRVQFYLPNGNKTDSPFFPSLVVTFYPPKQKSYLQEQAIKIK